MGLGTQNRKPGTGSVRREKRSPYYTATLPRGPGVTRGAVLGRYDTAYAAHKALDAWVAAQQEKKAG